MQQVTAAQAQEALRALLHQWTKAVETQDHAYFQRHMDDGWRLHHTTEPVSAG
jgi:hypothetical protein